MARQRGEEHRRRVTRVRKSRHRPRAERRAEARLRRPMMTAPDGSVVARLARFVVARSWDDLSAAAREQLKIRVLDSLGCALGALDAPPVGAVRKQVEEFGGRPLCTLIGGARTAPDRAALYNGALIP